MTLALVSLGIISLLELLLWTPLLWKGRAVIARLLLAALLIATAALLFECLAAWTILIAILSLYRCVNMARVAAGRIQADYLYHASRQTAVWLITFQLAVTAIAGIGYRYHIEPIVWWDALAAVQLSCAVILLTSTFRHLRTSRKPALEEMRDTDLPSLTVAIPARNETTDLEECLRSLTASTYPKLEIVVLDDCSQNKRTPEIIREFAHNGVQFIAGTPPPGQWLAKNHAYAQLADAANGELLLFCGVDTRFEPQSLTVIVRTLLQKHKTMVSILPKNLGPKRRNIVSWFLQPSRYAWELALPRRLLQRPPVLSTCWLITRQALKDAGGFQAVRRKGVPESYLARATANRQDGYSFLLSDADIGVTSRKSPDEQKATAVRTRYLQLHRRPELTALVGLAELSVLVWPLIICVVSVITGEWLLAGVSGLSFFMDTVMYARIVNLTYRRFILKGLWLLPLATLYDIGLLNSSMWQYEFSEVLWKGRNVCIPVMRVIPELPELTSSSG
jgi:glycosyltransferase involved in cell wall biosynthesis